jgi:hypothetical protein
MDDPHVFPIQKAPPNRPSYSLFNQGFGRVGRIRAVRSFRAKPRQKSMRPQGDPMLAQHLHSLMMFQRRAIANGYGWQRFLHMVDQVLPRRGDTLQLPFNDPNLDKEATTNGPEAQNEGQDIRKER